MTSQPNDTPPSAPTGPAAPPGGGAPVDDPTGAGETTARQLTDPLRQPAAFVLLIANGLILLFAALDLLVITEDWPTNFLARAGGAGVDFVGVVAIGFPLLAVLLATHVKPLVPRGRLIAVLALVEYGVSALFGALCLMVDFLHGMTDSQTTLGVGSARRAFEDFLVRAGEFAVLAVAAVAVYQIFQGLYMGVRQIAPQPPYGGGYPIGYAQPGYPPDYGQPNYPAGFHPYGQPGTWGGQPAPGAHPAPDQNGDSGPGTGDGAQPTRPARPPNGPEGTGEQWGRP